MVIQLRGPLGVHFRRSQRHDLSYRRNVSQDSAGRAIIETGPYNEFDAGQVAASHFYRRVLPECQQALYPRPPDFHVLLRGSSISGDGAGSFLRDDLREKLSVPPRVSRSLSSNSLESRLGAAAGDAFILRTRRSQQVFARGL